MLSVQTNILAWNADRQLGINRKKKEKSAEKLASGYRINRAADDAAGLSISEKMRRQVRGLQKGKENITDGISWVQTGDGAMEEIAQMIHRMEELAVKAANGTLQAADRAAIDEEIKHLKKEINEIAKWTTFNDKKIFDNDQPDIEIEGTLDDLQVYNATYDDKTGDVTYGGFLFRGQRISWDSISPDMVSYDPDTNQQIFKGGSYDFWDQEGFHFQINCEPGAKVPEITRTVRVGANAAGITIDGTTIPWENFYDEDGRNANETCHDGTWYTDYKGLTIAYFFPDGMIGSRQDMIDAISSLNTGESKVQYQLGQIYEGPSPEKAVDVVKVDQLRLSNHLANDLLHVGNHDQIQPDGTTVNPHQVGYVDENNNFSVIVRAAKADPNDPNSRDGVWLEYEYKCKYQDANGNLIEDTNRVEAENSYRTWEELGLKDWFNGYDVKGGNYQYVYTGDDGNDGTVNDTYLSFSFNLSDITSKDSVIDGLDEMVISGRTIHNNYGTEIDINLDDNIIMAGSSSHNPINFQEEKALGRDFDQKTVDDVAHNNLVYDPTTGKVSLQFEDSAGNAVIQFEGEADKQKALMDSDLQAFGRYVEMRKAALALAGKDPQSEDLASYGLADLLGNDKITSSGYFDEIITINDGMHLSDGIVGDKYFHPGEVGQKYPAAKIDFSGLGTGADGTISSDQLDQLIGVGFDSTCKTCDRHYSIVFTDGGSEATTDKGYGYSYRDNYPNYTLQIDISTFKGQGDNPPPIIDTAAKLADVIVDIVSACYDFHYTQYASEKGVLYMYDNRPQNSPAPNATFDPYPFQAIDIGDYKFSMATDDGRTIDTSYKFRYSDFADNIVVEMQQDNNGAYIKQTDADGAEYYEVYDPAVHGNAADADRYKMVTTYKNMDGDEVKTLQEARDSYASYAFDKMLNGTAIHLNALDYTTMSVNGNENGNVAIRSIFNTEFSKVSVDNGISIRCSAQDGDRTTIPRFGVSTFALKLYKAGAKTQEQADHTIAITKEALTRLNDRRTIYGAMQNRLEHAYNVRDNIEENTQASESRLRDTDVAKEMLDYSNQNILMQAGVSMLTQANSSSQFALQLLQ